MLNQYIADMYIKIETERLNYIRFNQSKLRVEEYIHLQDAVSKDGEQAEVGQLVILPSSFTGGPRYMHEHTQYAMHYVKKYGKANLSITFTCNPNWDEIKSNLMPGQTPTDRHDIVVRIFKQNITIFINLIVMRL